MLFGFDKSTPFKVCLCCREVASCIGSFLAIAVKISVTFSPVLADVSKNNKPDSLA